MKLISSETSYIVSSRCLQIRSKHEKEVTWFNHLRNRYENYLSWFGPADRCLDSCRAYRRQCCEGGSGDPLLSSGDWWRENSCWPGFETFHNCYQVILCRKGWSIANAEHAFTSRTYLNKRTLSYWEIWGSRINTGYQKWWRIGEESRINSRTSIKFCCNEMPLTSFICIYVIFKLINHKLCNAGPSDPTPYLSLSHIYIGNHPIGPIS